MTVCKRDFHNSAIYSAIHKIYSAIHIIFVAWVVFVKAIFSCLNLKPDDGFLTYNMSELLNKTRHGLTDIVIALDEFKLV